MSIEWIDDEPLSQKNETDDSSNDKQKLLRAIAAGTIAALVLVCLTLSAFWFYIESLQQARVTPTSSPTPTFTPSLTPTATRVTLRYFGNGTAQFPSTQSAQLVTPTQTKPPLPTVTATAPAILPTSSNPVAAQIAQMIIPSINVNAPMIRIPISKGVWDVEQITGQVGLLDTTGRKPGDALAMAIAGHVTLRGGIAGPFLQLAQLKPGAQVTYRLDKIDYIYTVTGVETVPPEEVVKLYVESGSTLLLTTCADYDATSGAYRSRTLVTASLTEQRKSP